MATTTIAAQAYARAAQMGIEGVGDLSKAKPAEAGQPDFASFVQQSLSQAMEQGKAAEEKSAAHIVGDGELIDVVTAISAAEATLETVVAVRDRVISAYQEISRMPI